MRSGRRDPSGRVALRGLASRAIRTGVIRRVAFGLEGLDRLLGRNGRVLGELPPDLPETPSDCTLLAVVANWRGSGLTEAEPLLSCLRGLLAMDVRRTEVVIVTDRDEAAHAELLGWLATGMIPQCDVVRGPWIRPGTARRTVVVERWRPRRPYRHGFYLTWEHKRIFRRVARTGSFTRLLYLEDDIAFSETNLAYWLTARRTLHARGLLPGYVRFEWKDGVQMLSDQARPGQHVDGGPNLDIPGVGQRTVRVSRRAYQALVLLDAPLLDQHLERSNTRTPLRSNVLRWGVRERACAGEIFAPTENLLAAILRPGNAPRPRSRHAVLIESDAQGGRHLDAGALVEHLRPTASLDPRSKLGTVPVAQF